MKTSCKAKVLYLSNHKSGVGKTCFTCNIGTGLSKGGYRVLLIDLDPQANMSLSLGLTDVEKSIYSVLVGNCSMEEAIYHIAENLDIIPANVDVAGVGLGEGLKKCINKIDNDYDFIIIDCAPSLGILATKALTASDKVYIPLQAQYLSLLRRRSKKLKKPYKIKWSPEEIFLAIKIPPAIYSRKKKQVNEILEDAYSVAKRLGYLIEYDLTGHFETRYKKICQQ